MRAAQKGDRVEVHYTGRLEDGQVFDSSEGQDPLEFSVGSDELIPGFSEGVVGMEEGDSRKLEIEPERGYGERRDALLESVDKARMPGEVSVGDQLMAEAEGGVQFPVRVVEVTDENVTLDGNHPLAGKTLIFDVTLVSVKAAD